MWDPDLTPLPEGHDPWAWRAGVGFFAALLLIWHLFDLDRYVSFFGWAISGVRSSSSSSTSASVTS